MLRTTTFAALLFTGATLLADPSPRNAMIEVLRSSDPNPILGDEAKTFDRLVGTWDADFSFPRKDGTVTHKKGELHFGWVMDGTAIQDLWIGYPDEAGKERNIGTTLRFFDNKTKQWHIVFINPRFSYVVTAEGRREGENIVFHGTDADGLPLRWTFSEITADSFHWQGTKSYDSGKTWVVEEDHHMKRRSASGQTSTATFTQMKSLVGEWKAVQDGVPVTETYKLTANGSTLMAETRPGNESPMITMITADGDRLIATHYCVAGNQPNMVATSPDDLHKGVAFTLDRVTGMKTPDDWHNTGITIALDDPDHMTQTWSWLYKGKSGTTVFHYTRAKVDGR